MKATGWGLRLVVLACLVGGSACDSNEDSPAGTGGAGSGGSGAGAGGTHAGNDAATHDGGPGGEGGTGGSPLDGGAGDAQSDSSANDAGSRDAGPQPVPSAGCSNNAGRPENGQVIVADHHYLAFPAGYDGTTPMPVLFGFHGCAPVNRGTDIDSTEWMRETNGTAFADEYVRAVPVSAASDGCWRYGDDIDRVKSVYDELLANHCVDTSRVFATGHSSGAQFITQVLLTQHVNDAQHFGFKAVTPFASSDYGAQSGPMPVLYIQGQMDAERGNGDGHEAVARFASANSCGSTSTPYTQVAGCMSGATSVTPGCIRYDGCAATTIWCSHNDPNYSGTQHGIPCFGLTAMHDFFQSLP